MKYSYFDLKLNAVSPGDFIKKQEYSSRYKQLKRVEITPFSVIKQELGIFMVGDFSILEEIGNCVQIAYEIARDSDGMFNYVEGIIRFDELDKRLFYKDEKKQFQGIFHAWNYCPELNKYFDLKKEILGNYYDVSDQENYEVIMRPWNYLRQVKKLPIIKGEI